jgi:hypothetical protein
MTTIKLMKVTTLFIVIVSILIIVVSCTKKVEPTDLPDNQVSPEDTVQKRIEISTDGSSYSKSLLIKSDQEGIIETNSSTGTKYTFVIPKNAISPNDSVKIIITPIKAVNNLPKGIKFLAAMQFEPEGLTLFKPANLTITLPVSVTQDSLVGFSYQEAGSDFHLIPIPQKDSIISSPQSLSISISHFSGVIVGLGTLTDCANQGYPTNPESIYEQGIGCVLNEHNQLNEELTNDDINIIHDILIAWFDQIVLPKLNSATTLDALKDIVSNTFVRWSAIAAQTGFKIPDDFKDQFESAEVPIRAMLEKDLSKRNIACSNETDRCKLIQYFNEYIEWNKINQIFFNIFNLNIDILDINSFCGGKMYTTISKLEIMSPDVTTMETKGCITFVGAELRNYLNQPINGNVFWKTMSIPWNAGVIQDNFKPTVCGRREGEVFLIATAIPAGSSNSYDTIGCVTDTVRIIVKPNCEEKPLQEDCHSRWSASVQFMCPSFKESDPTCTCNEGYRMREYIYYDFNILLELGDYSDYVVGRLYVTGGTDKRIYYYCLPYLNPPCHTQKTEIQLVQTADDILHEGRQIDDFNRFWDSYNDFWGNILLEAQGGSGFYRVLVYHGTIHGNTGSITIDCGAGILNEVELTKISYSK